MNLVGREILIVGAGIAGLAAARALAMRGAQVSVLEQAPAITEVGAGLQISPNGGRVLDALGLSEALEAVSIASRAVVLRDMRGRQVLRLDLSGLDRFSLVHRADLIALLESGAREAGVRIDTGAEVLQVLPSDEGGVIELADGTRLGPALVIGADGLHSRVRAAIEGTGPADFTGQVAWRAVIEGGEAPPEAQVFMGPGRHVVAYPLRGGQMTNLVAVEERTAWAEEGWHHAGNADDLRAAFSSFGGPVEGWLARVEAPMVWGLFRHPVAERWFAPGLALCGDAAHPTLPFLAQGACMALEDAWALADALTGFEDDHSALHAYQRSRRPRTKRIVDAATANARNYHLRWPMNVIAHAGLRGIGAIAPRAPLARFDWLYGFDVTSGGGFSPRIP